MGFLDFLKKQPPAIATPVPPSQIPEAPLPPMPETPTLPPPLASGDDQLLSEMMAVKNNDIVPPDNNFNLPLPPITEKKPDFLEAAAVDMTPLKEPIENPIGAESARVSVPTATMLAGPLRREQIPPELDESDSERLPLPPVSMQDPDFLTSAASDMRTNEPAKTEESREVQPAVQQVPIAAIDLPDFTDEDVAAVEKSDTRIETIGAWTSEPKPEMPSITIKTKEPIVAAPANAIARPKDEMLLPTGEAFVVADAEPAKFLSSSNYFAITAEIRAARKILRQNDDIIKDATLAHEQLDQQHKRVAIDANAVQEQLMRIDSALFEE